MSYKLDKPYTQMQRNDFIVLYNRNQGLRIEETETALYALESNEVMKDDEPVVNPDYDAEQLAIAKAAKHSENLQLAYKAEEEGSVLYNDAVFETTPSNISKLTSLYAMIQSGFIESVQWLSKNDIQVELEASDIVALGRLIAEYTGALWNVQYLAYKDMIENAKSIQELNQIEINY